MNGAAFFDLDGTMLSGPSLEARFFWHALRRGYVAPRSMARWALEQARICAGAMHSSASAMFVATQNNKRWLADIRESAAIEWTREYGPRLRYFREAIERVEWHLARSQKVFVVTGSLGPLVRGALRMHPVLRAAHVIATELVADGHGCFIGESLGPAVCAQEKARVIREIAKTRAINLSQSYAYANASADRWFLAAVRRSFAINPDRGLSTAARDFGWPVLRWSRENIPEMSRATEATHPSMWRKMENF
jgi:phosphoserine phosphatase